ncbi:unnamed protein product [Somion occarium]|uniref:Phosphoglycerate mutase-like protein n=1 Tax=Somion occarium TaxID=3059160 RepID=A0ABP1DCK4_9APHY
MPTARIFIVRHGETDANRQEIIQGQLDTELNAAGVEQVQLTCQALEKVPFSVAYSSDLGRAAKTAEIILTKHSGVELKKCNELRERYMGDLQGRRLSELRNTSPANVESVSDFSKRAVRWWNSIVQRHVLSVQQEELETPLNILVTTHGGLIRILLQGLIGSRKLRWGQGVKLGRCLNASVTVINLEGNGKGEVVSFADTTHLNVELVEVNADTVAEDVVDDTGGGGRV